MSFDRTCCLTPSNLVRSIAGNYLHFNRVDSYVNFPGSDPHDGQQLPQDQQGNLRARFEKAPHFSAADYYDQSRTRTYACCFSLENSDFIWRNYANDSRKGKVCIVFPFGKLRRTLNETIRRNEGIAYGETLCRQIFSINYGLVSYVEWRTFHANEKLLPNPIRYTYFKDKQFCNEKELRVSLSAPGIGAFALNDGTTLDFPPSLHAAFDFRAAIKDGTIRQILRGPDYDSTFLHAELAKLGIGPAEGSDPPVGDDSSS